MRRALAQRGRSPRKRPRQLPLSLRQVVALPRRLRLALQSFPLPLPHSPHQRNGVRGTLRRRPCLPSWPRLRPRRLGPRRSASHPRCRRHPQGPLRCRPRPLRPRPQVACRRGHWCRQSPGTLSRHRRCSWVQGRPKEAPRPLLPLAARHTPPARVRNHPGFPGGASPQPAAQGCCVRSARPRGRYSSLPPSGMA